MIKKKNFINSIKTDDTKISNNMYQEEIIRDTLDGEFEFASKTLIFYCIIAFKNI